MHRSVTIVALLSAVTLVSVAWDSTDSNQDSRLVGAWVATAWEYDGNPVADPQRGLLVFTERNYSMMFVFGETPRPRYSGDGLADAEKISAYDSFVANSGRYTVSGNEITTEAYMAKDPNYMDDWESNQVTLTYRFEGEMLHVTWPSDFSSTRLAGTFRKVGTEAR